MNKTATANSKADLDRRALLAKVHIGKKELGLTDDQYGAMLTAFKVESARDLSIPQLENLVKLMKHHGFKPTRRRRLAKGSGNPDQAEALRRRCVELAKTLENGEKRLMGLSEKICGTSALAWCRDVGKLSNLLAVLGKIRGKEMGS
ncbi:MAG: phage protein GemA/Gp16 family protein [Candidatus Omnitrophota bacterium]|nr:phage protein GemA/Gp16 family protein [Candidatus Omnitrophota bacterium]